ncbi:phenylalanine--tRNA ligase subunit alpha [Tuwongella immobilis]|uniref:Phenylalanine--tRNA ligase alpha subunit n=1 Tax=Tuwongella immobilis TaxID=692036 RepID=A0A6C2YVP4_9BACT|nr:phenylalanine--tRNA ligase subunit alpha [Tuwongella immobilis]VIP05514.1 phenylalanyl-trna synthetase subunit alpha : Phenylalanine--tRNA ligase alpha subunit OS=Candidatus Entotheonella sp. TSY1 GN=pheS PE=3 SV=1: Phe_tRNA-synt_N: tRNA-synt_2d [Tuwongella immobilis]VTS08384.1 phenylalanyl-trna synthetase subunit alpha : Phenylalanine--tRNA ligase alpha subunit OS=Candidatus Entotheonella sp. TSY1 GN=pheS PE=3 SV=1: Phe_tRNA-synt_N: tRNA-synt_2d [Tuwongella immobilis]
MTAELTISNPDLAALLQRGLADLHASTDEPALKAWNTRYFGPTGEVPAATKKVATLPPPERKGYGQEANRVKEALSQAYEQSLATVKEAALLASLNANPLDVTLPGRRGPLGRPHIASRVLRNIYSVFADMGFQVYRSREVEDDLTNFELLNMPPHHPARDMWDTFHTTTPGVILRTHTSPGQIHVMREMVPNPIRVILPGMVYRYEQVTTRSEMQFHQVEGLVVGEGITMADLKGTITSFARRMFGQERQIRIRSSYFPFTEPSIEVDIDWPKEDPNADRLTKGTGWLEIMGAGMIHPTVLRNGGYDPDRVSGFAFGMGPQRITMLQYAIDDIRQFWSNDLRFLRQF